MTSTRGRVPGTLFEMDIGFLTGPLIGRSGVGHDGRFEHDHQLRCRDDGQGLACLFRVLVDRSGRRSAGRLVLRARAGGPAGRARRRAGAPSASAWPPHPGDPGFLCHLLGAAARAEPLHSAAHCAGDHVGSGSVGWVQRGGDSASDRASRAVGSPYLTGAPPIQPLLPADTQPAWAPRRRPGPICPLRPSVTGGGAAPSLLARRCSRSIAGTFAAAAISWPPPSSATLACPKQMRRQVFSRVAHSRAPRAGEFTRSSSTYPRIRL